MILSLRMNLSQQGGVRTRPARVSAASAPAVLALALAAAVLFTLPAAAMPAPLMPGIGAKQFAALADDAFGVSANPAGLMRVQHRSILLHVTTPASSGIGSPTSRLIAYAEPDTGLGAGALSAYSTPDAAQYMYSVARKFQAATTLGASVKYRAAQGRSWWAMDVGLQHDLAQEATFGISVRNALSTQERTSDETAPEPQRLPAQAQIGVALRNGKGLLIAADYAVLDLSAAANTAVLSVIAGVELGRAVLWAGEQSIGPDFKKALILGFEIRSGALQFTLAAFDAGENDRALALGVAYRF